jgi:hypothetical protein
MLALCLSLSGCFELFSCGNEVLWEGKSPSGNLTATMFKRNCGATTGYSQVIAVRASATAFDGEDNTNWVFLSDAEPPTKAAWEGNDVLRIHRLSGKGVFLEVHVFRGMQIRYNDEPL